MLKMDTFILARLTLGEREDCIAMRPEEIAQVMGNDAVIQYLVTLKKQRDTTSLLPYRNTPTFFRAADTPLFGTVKVDPFIRLPSKHASP